MNTWTYNDNTEGEGFMTMQTLTRGDQDALAKFLGDSNVGHILYILFVWNQHSHLSRHPTRGRGSLDRLDHQAHCSHFQSQSQGSSPNLFHKKQTPCCWDTFYGRYMIPDELPSYPRETAAIAPYRLCHPDCLPSRCSLFLLFRPLLGWILEGRRKCRFTRSISAFWGFFLM